MSKCRRQEKEIDVILLLNIHSEKGGSLKVKSPFGKFEQKIKGKVKISQSGEGFILIDFEPNSSVELKGI